MDGEEPSARVAEEDMERPGAVIGLDVGSELIRQEGEKSLGATGAGQFGQVLRVGGRGHEIPVAVRIRDADDDGLGHPVDLAQETDRADRLHELSLAVQNIHDRVVVGGFSVSAWEGNLQFALLVKDF